MPLSNEKMTFSVDKDEIRAFIAILLISGYSVLSWRWMMWEQSEDVQNRNAPKLMNKDRFNKILCYLQSCCWWQISKSRAIIQDDEFHNKLWCLNSCLGYLVQCEPYSRKSQTVPALGLGGSVVTKLMKPLPENLSFLVSFDNFFTSLNLLRYLGS